jgi:hypothetical protein
LASPSTDSKNILAGSPGDLPGLIEIDRHPGSIQDRPFIGFWISNPTDFLDNLLSIGRRLLRIGFAGGVAG